MKQWAECHMAEVLDAQVGYDEARDEAGVQA
jgi:hypothetical protein